MSDLASAPGFAIPPDDPQRKLTIGNANAPTARHVSVAGDTCTILIGSAQTAGRHCLIDMHMSPGGGPPSHRHDFEEMFTLLEDEIEFTLRGEMFTVAAGSTVNIPANAPHAFKNASDQAARMLCYCTPAGQDEFFVAIGDPVDSRTVSPPRLSDEGTTEWQQEAARLAAKYRTEFLKD